MADRLDMPDLLLDLLTRPPVQQLAQHHPYRTVVHTIPSLTLAAEAMEIQNALDAGGYTKTQWVEPLIPAIDVLIGQLHEIAVEQDIRGYHTGHVVNQNGDLEITMVFASVSDAMMFKMNLPW